MDVGFALRHAARLPLADRCRGRRSACVRDARRAGRPAVIQDVSADPAGFTPNGDGKTDTTAIAYELGGAAAVRIDLQTEQGSPLATLQTAPRAAGRHVFVWNGGGYPDGALPDRGRGAVGWPGGDGDDERRSQPDAFGFFGILPAAISPNGDGRADSLAASFNLALPALANLSIRRGTAVVSVFDSLLPIGLHTVAWPGGVRDGVYSLTLTSPELDRTRIRRSCRSASTESRRD